MKLWEMGFLLSMGIMLGAGFVGLFYEINNGEICQLTKNDYLENYYVGFDDAIEFVLDGERDDRCNMRFKKNITNMVQGLYSHDNYICVWTKNRSMPEIQSTWSHETAHWWSHYQPEHFSEVE